MKVVFTCGGTGGHINPAIAVAKVLKLRRPDSEILFVGAQGEMEEKLVPREGFRLETLRISSYERSLSPKSIVHNIKALYRVFSSRRRANQIIEEFQPDVIVGTGGYASYPMLRQGAKKGIPTAVHEANAMPGLTTRMVADSAKSIMVCFEDSKAHYPHPERVEVVGMPVREEFIYTKRQDARKRLNIPEDAVLIVSAWGSLGAREMNKKIADFIQCEASDGTPFYHIHATGSFGWRWMPGLVSELGVDLKKYPRIDMREYIFNMPDVMAAADLFISRAGASSLNEIAAAGVPCIIVPSPNVTDDHQDKNARVLERRGAAIVVKEADCTGKSLYETAKLLVNDPERCAKMRSALRSLAVVDSAGRICDTVIRLAKSR